MESTAHQHTTAWLLDRARSGDRQAHRQLVERVEPLLRRFAHGRIPQLLRHKEDTADLVQLTWLKVLDKLDGIDAREPGAFFAYLRAVLIADQDSHQIAGAMGDRGHARRRPPKAGVAGKPAMPRWVNRVAEPRSGRNSAMKMTSAGACVEGGGCHGDCR
jgi:hypothetical protein